MEDLLRAYARKRREEAGAPFELAPDVRARLHEEVRRALGKPAAAPPPRWGLSLADWLRLAVGGAVAALVILMVRDQHAAARSNPAICQSRNLGIQRQEYFTRAAGHRRARAPRSDASPRRAAASARRVNASARRARLIGHGGQRPGCRRCRAGRQRQAGNGAVAFVGRRRRHCRAGQIKGTTDAAHRR